MTTTEKVAHTPGPWKVYNTYKVPQGFGSGRDIGCSGIAVATANGGVYIDAETVDANARLIAAAPEMLEALIEVADSLQEFSDEHDGRYAVAPEIQARCEAAIRKARGE